MNNGLKRKQKRSRASEYTKFILDDRLDVDEANARWSKEFMAHNGLTAEDLAKGG